MNLAQWWQRPAAKTRRHAIPTLEPLEDRCVMSAVGFAQVNLASDLPGLARSTVPSLVNPWGISFSPTGPFWFADQGSGVSNLLDGRGQVVPLIVAVPPAGALIGSPTGTVFNSGPGFTISANGATGPSTFLFASVDGTISGWTEAVDVSNAVVVVDNSALHAEYTGLALAANGSGQSFLYAANVSLGRIDVFDENFSPVVRPGAFQDPNLPAGFAPYNVQNVAGSLYVEYAARNVALGKMIYGAGLGCVDVYSTDGTLLNRFASQGTLNAPWGVTLAPADFGRFGGALLIGNNGDGRINAYSPTTGAFLGQLADDRGTPIVIPGLWALTFGNGYEGGNAETLFFAAGYDNGLHGLFGAIQPPQLRGADTGGEGSFDPNAPGEAKDYPLPPVQGPALQGPNTNVRTVSVLLPLADSSLALVPTLAVVPQQAPAAPGSANPVVVAALEGQAATVTRFIAQDSAVTSDDPYDPVTINSLLDLNAASNRPVDLSVRPRVFREIDTSYRSTSVGDDASVFADFVVGEERPERSEAPAFPLASSVASAGGIRSVTSAPDAAAAPSGWTRVLASLLGVVAINALAEYLPGRLRRKVNPSPALRGDL